MNTKRKYRRRSSTKRNNNVQKRTNKKRRINKRSNRIQKRTNRKASKVKLYGGAGVEELLKLQKEDREKGKGQLATVKGSMKQISLNNNGYLQTIIKGLNALDSLSATSYH
tara:strand:+ start:544 stop:876 length:333 start_codon:yes stop_codon:yes gene_type:complete